MKSIVEMLTFSLLNKWEMKSNKETSDSRADNLLLTYV